MPAPKLVEVKKIRPRRTWKRKSAFAHTNCTKSGDTLPGHEDEDWLVAEQEILSRHDSQQSA